METMLDQRRCSDPSVEVTQVLQNDSHPLEILRRLNALRTEAVFTDTILCVGHEEIPCHRNVLAVSSPYFKAMFSSDLRESREGRISFNELSSKTLRQLVDYVYTGRVEVTVDNAQDILAAASLFHYPEVVEFCCQFLFKHLHPSNCLGIEEYSHLHSCDKLEADAHQFVLENFAAVCESEEFLELSAVRLMSYIASDLIEVRTERFVFEAVLKWVNFDLEKRRNSLCMVLKGIRFFALDIDYLEEVVKRNFHIASCAACSDQVSRAAQIFLDATDLTDALEKLSIPTNFLPRPSTMAKQVLALVGSTVTDNKVITVLEVYNPRKDRWSTLPDLPVGVCDCSVSAVGDDIVVTGGVRDGCVVASVWKFISTKRRWTELPSMLGPRARHASAAWNSKLYVIGGIRNTNAPLSAVEAHARSIETIECLDLSATNPTWCHVGSPPCPRIHSHVIPFNTVLVEIGGTQCGAVVQTMESYHCTDKDVKYSGEQYVLPEPIEFSKMAVIDGIFYIIWLDTKKVILLNPEKRTFRRLADLSCPHICGGAAVINKCIYVAGGRTKEGPTRVIECYNPLTDKWTLVRSLRQALVESHCVAIEMC